MFDLNLMTAKVVDINDKDKQGKIQINIESKFKNFKKDLLPWAIPLFSDTSSDTMSFNPPSVNSQVWILVDKYYKRFYYLTNRYFYNLFDFSKVSGLLDKCNKINKDYQNITFRYFKDKTLIFHNNEDGSSGIITSQGTLIYIDKDGDYVRNIEKNEIVEVKGDREEVVKGNTNIKINGNSETTIDGKNTIKSKSLSYSSDNEISIKSKGIDLIELGNNVSTLGQILNELCQDLASLETVGIALPEGSTEKHLSPSLTLQMNTLIPKIRRTFK